MRTISYHITTGNKTTVALRSLRADVLKQLYGINGNKSACNLRQSKRIRNSKRIYDHLIALYTVIIMARKVSVAIGSLVMTS